MLVAALAGGFIAGAGVEIDADELGRACNDVEAVILAPSGERWSACGQLRGLTLAVLVVPANNSADETVPGEAGAAVRAFAKGLAGGRVTTGGIVAELATARREVAPALGRAV